MLLTTTNNVFLCDRFIRATGRPAGSAESLDILAAASIEATDATAAGGQTKPRKFTMNAYTGAPLVLPGWRYPVVVDLAGLSLGNSDRPILVDHVADPDWLLGQTDKVAVVNNQLLVEGRVYGVTARAKQIIALNDQGFRFQASIGARVQRAEFVEPGHQATANGRDYPGPVYIARASALGEVSFVVLGADDKTSARIAAHAAQKGMVTMTFEQWIAALGLDAASLTDVQKNNLRAKYDAEIKASALGNAGTGTAGSAGTNAGQASGTVQATGATGGASGATGGSGQVTDPTELLRNRTASEMDRINAIQEVCGTLFPKIAAQAVREGWDRNKTELEVIRASRPASGAPGMIIHGTPAPTGDVIEAAMCLSLRLPGVEKQFKPETLEAAHRNHRNIGLQEVILAAAVNNGYRTGPGGRIHQGNLREVLQYAFAPVQAAGFSTFSLPGIMSNVANKELLAGYMEEDQTWREISVVKTVRDFKKVTSYRMLDDMEYEELGPDGQIKHGTVGEESYTRQASTYAKMFGLSRQDIINDDLGTLDDLRTRLGRGAAKKFSNVFWKIFLDNSTFFTSGRGNYISGATTTLLVDGVGLQLAVTAFRKLKSPVADGAKKVGMAVGGQPKILLVPPELEFTAQRLYGSITPNTVADQNIHAGKYKPVVVPWLSDSNFTGFSATGWYLLRAPAELAAVVVSFLNGVETPTVEVSDADFNQLGIQMRGFHDFGVDAAEYLAGVKSKGAA